MLIFVHFAEVDSCFRSTLTNSLLYICWGTISANIRARCSLTENYPYQGETMLYDQFTVTRFNTETGHGYLRQTANANRFPLRQEPIGFSTKIGEGMSVCLLPCS